MTDDIFWLLMLGCIVAAFLLNALFRKFFKDDGWGGML